jgi:hypothetical protein
MADMWHINSASMWPIVTDNGSVIQHRQHINGMPMAK